MAAAAIPTALLIVQLVEAAIPGAEALWAAIQNFHQPCGSRSVALSKIC